MAKGISTTTLLLIGGGLVGGYFILTKTGMFNGGGLSDTDKMILNQLADQQSASDEQRQFMIEMAADMKMQKAAAGESTNLWEDPATYTSILDSVFAGIKVFI